MAARNWAGTETLPFLSILFSKVDRNNATVFYGILLVFYGIKWEIMEKIWDVNNFL
jgi:hypothetical protein